MTQEKRIKNIPENLVDSKSMSKEMLKSIKPVGTTSGNIDGLCKVPEQNVDG